MMFYSTDVIAEMTIGDQRRIMREGSWDVKEGLASGLYERAVKKRTADTAMRALSLWPYWCPAERTFLITLIVKSKEPHAGNHAAYTLARLTELWGRTVYWLTRTPLEERMWIITRFITKGDFESAELALSWSETSGIPLHINERKLLTTFLQNKPL